MTLVNIKYVGRKPRKVDNVADTGLEWEPGDVHAVPRALAGKFLRHPDVWAQVDGDPVALPQARKQELFRDAQDPQFDEEDDADHVRQGSVLPNITTMNVKSLVGLAKVRYGRDLDDTKSAAELRAEIVQLENGGA